VAKAKVQPTDDVQEWLQKYGSTPLKQPVVLRELLKRPEVKYASFSELGMIPGDLSAEVIEQVDVLTKYEGYIKRQNQLVEKF